MYPCREEDGTGSSSEKSRRSEAGSRREEDVKIQCRWKDSLQPSTSPPCPSPTYGQTPHIPARQCRVPRLRTDVFVRSDRCIDTAMRMCTTPEESSVEPGTSQACGERNFIHSLDFVGVGLIRRHACRESGAPPSTKRSKKTEKRPPTEEDRTEGRKKKRAGREEAQGSEAKDLDLHMRSGASRSLQDSRAVCCTSRRQGLYFGI